MRKLDFYSLGTIMIRPGDDETVGDVKKHLEDLTGFPINAMNLVLRKHGLETIEFMPSDAEQIVHFKPEAYSIHIVEQWGATKAVPKIMPSGTTMRFIEPNGNWLQMSTTISLPEGTMMKFFKWAPYPPLPILQIAGHSIANVPDSTPIHNFKGLQWLSDINHAPQTIEITLDKGANLYSLLYSGVYTKIKFGNNRTTTNTTSFNSTTIASNSSMASSSIELSAKVLGRFEEEVIAQLKKIFDPPKLPTIPAALNISSEDKQTDAMHAKVHEIRTTLKILYDKGLISWRKCAIPVLEFLLNPDTNNLTYESDDPNPIGDAARIQDTHEFINALQLAIRWHNNIIPCDNICDYKVLGAADIQQTQEYLYKGGDPKPLLSKIEINIKAIQTQILQEQGALLQ